MTVFEWINANFELVETLTNSNLMKYKVKCYFTIYSRYRYYVQNGNKKTPSIEQACKDYHTSRDTGFIAIKEMEKII